MNKLIILLLFFAHFGRALATPVPRRIVSLSIGGDELLWNLLPKSERILSLSSLASDPKYSCLPSEAHSLTSKVSSEPEALVAAKPDFVIAATYNRPEFLTLLRSAKIPTQVLENFDTLDDMKKNIEQLGQRLKLQAEARQLNTKLDEESKALRLPAKFSNVTLLSYSSEYRLAGSGTTFDQLRKLLGLKNLAADIGLRNFSLISREKLGTLNPDWLIVNIDPGESEQSLKQLIRKDPIWRLLPAVTDGRMIFVPTPLMLSIGPCMLRAAKEIRDALVSLSP